MNKSTLKAAMTLLRQQAPVYYSLHRKLWLERIKDIMYNETIDLNNLMHITLPVPTSIDPSGKSDCLGCSFFNLVCETFPTYYNNCKEGCLFSHKCNNQYIANCFDRPSPYHEFCQARSRGDKQQMLKYAWEIYYYPMSDNWREDNK